MDVLITENIVMNYLILLITAKFSRRQTSSLRMFMGALAGALYVAFLIIQPEMKIYYTTLAKILLSLLMVAIAFSPEKISSFFKTLATFYVSTFIFAGAALAFLYFKQSGGLVKNGVIFVFGQTGWTQLLFSVITVGIIIKVFWDIWQSRIVRERLQIPLKISFNSKVTDIAALVDTGNFLHDPLTNTPVIVVEFSAVKDILPPELNSIFEEAKENDLSSVTDIISSTSWFSRFRLIPFTSLGKENGMLIGFKPDYIEIGESEDKKDISNVIVGICNRKLSGNGGYKALLSPELI